MFSPFDGGILRILKILRERWQADALPHLRTARKWIRRRSIRLAAGITGLGGFLSVLYSAERITGTTVLAALLFGLFASVPVVLIEEVLIRLHGRAPGGEMSESSGDKSTTTSATSTDEGGTGRTGGRSIFRGRASELAQLAELHGAERSARTGRGEAGARPIVLLIHGQPGVGKSALAQELSLRLRPQYPDGVMSVNFGKAGGPAPPAEILKKLLLKLGRPEGDVPAGVKARANLLRSMTVGKKILFVFDAARNHDQVLHVLPTEPCCAVIITSRRDLSAQLNVSPPRAPLEVPPLDDALEILSAWARFDWTLQAEHAIEVVELCGRLPGAMVSAAERVAQDGTDLRHVADLLRAPDTRLSFLEQHGRALNERILSEFRRLLPRQQKALCLLTLVRSPTFVPWVLAPILDVDHREAENLMAALGAAQVLDNAGTDDATGLARYRFNPLVRLFAKEQLEQLLDQEYIDGAQARLDTAYIELVDDVLAQLHPAYRRISNRRGARKASGATQKIADHPEKNIRLEYGNLVHLIAVARERHHNEMCWRLAAMLKGCISPDVDQGRTDKAFEDGVAAARANRNPLGELDVQLARASFQIAVENYPKAFEILKSIADRPALSSNSPTDNAFALRRVQALRKIAEGFLQMGAYAQAAAWLETTVKASKTVMNDEEKSLIALLVADIYRTPAPEDTYGKVAAGVHLHDQVSFRARLGHSEENRRRGVWHAAEEDLLAAERDSEGDARRVASVQYRLARLYINQWRQVTPHRGFPSNHRDPGDPANDSAPDDPGILALPTQAIRRAAHAALAFRHMGNPTGVARARCLLARAMLIAGQPLAAEQLLSSVRRSFKSPAISQSPAHPTLLARYVRAYGELLLQHGAVGAAWRELCHAASRFESNQDFSSHAEIWQLIEFIEQNHSYPADSHPPDADLFEYPHCFDLETILSGSKSAASVPQQRAPRGRPEPLEDPPEDPPSGQPARV